jgi:hypothetical protein
MYLSAAAAIALAGGARRFPRLVWHPRQRGRRIVVPDLVAQFLRMCVV